MGSHVITIVVTITITRLFMWLMWDTSLMDQAKIDLWHHAYTGALIVLLSFSIKKYMPNLFPIMSGVGVGLLFDELTVPLCWIGRPVEYWSWVSVSTASISTFLYGLFVTRRTMLLTV